MLQNPFLRKADVNYIFEEGGKAEYDRYIFPYKVYAEVNPTISNWRWDKVATTLYSKGFLMSRLKFHRFYLCRSTRIDLKQFDLSSENRRVLRKCENIGLSVIPTSQFEYTYEIGMMGIDFYNRRFGKKHISAQGWKRIFNTHRFNQILMFTDNQKVVGYCPALQTDNFVHYAYPFYDLNYLEKNLGIGMILKAILHFKNGKDQIKHLYLGTCYTESALYKTGFKGFEWFDGQFWSDDIKGLKELVRG